MTDGAGVIRTAGGLQRTLTEIAEIEAAQPGNDPLLNMTATARLIVTAALLREESRGAHFRDDFPQADGTGQRSFLTLREACAHPAARHPEMT
jgi:L-aspartate oxidase